MRRMREARLRVAVTDRRGRPLRAPGVAAWLQRVAPASVRGDVAVALVSTAEIRALNRQFRRKDAPTDVLSFPGQRRQPDHRTHGEHLGDIVIATGIARRQARDAGHSLGAELKVLALHGLLHLLGYDHHARADRGRMARLERRLRIKGGLTTGLIERAGRRDSRERRGPAKRRANERAGETEGRRPSANRR
jgi:probable rRNA maturation factor